MDGMYDSQVFFSVITHLKLWQRISRQHENGGGIVSYFWMSNRLCIVKSVDTISCMLCCIIWKTFRCCLRNYLQTKINLNLISNKRCPASGQSNSCLSIITFMKKDSSHSRDNKFNKRRWIYLERKKALGSNTEKGTG